ncbi:MAG: colanic acid biosynthesis glycosyltransferase WcaL [Gammaproteobacteria bacterium]|nr:MAG: colanic acid biosynthesis glycosyltransferase WcaL [Gammaproteobacteria bacterium]
MRLAYFTNTYPRATDTFIRNEVLGLRKRGIDVITYSVRKTGSEHDIDADVVSEKQNTRYILPFKIFPLIALTFTKFIFMPVCFTKTLLLAIKTSRPGIKGHFLQIIYFLEAVVLAKHILDDEIEHVHNHLGDNSGTVALLAASLASIPFSISIHGPHIFFDGLHWALDVKTKYAKFISCIGYFCKSQMMLYSEKEYWSKFKIIRCGVDLKQFEYREPTNKARKILYVGRLSAEKGIPILFDSISKLKNQNYDIELTLLGDGDDRAYLENLSREKNLDSSIRFAGFVSHEEIAKSLRDSDIFVLPSFAEGIPVALMEAMAIGIPVIATAVGGVTELVVDQETGLVVSPADPDSLANAITRYVDSPDLCKSISTKARNKVAEEFNIDNQIDLLEGYFLEPNSENKN